MLSGYKTYIVSGFLVLIGLLEMVGITIPGVELPDNWLVIVLNGFGLSALRAGIGK